MSAFDGKRGYLNLSKCDLLELFATLIPQRSFYKVIETLAEACDQQSRAARQQSLSPDRGMEQLAADEARFYFEAGMMLVEMRHSLGRKWRQSAPATAHGDDTLAENQTTAALMNGNDYEDEAYIKALRQGVIDGMRE